MTAPIHDIASTYHLRRSGSRHVGQCPKCGGSQATDRFVLFADGGFKCYSCGFKGDRVRWLREMEGMSCREAHDAEGKGCSVSCPHYGPCRDGQPLQRARKGSVAVPSSAAAASVPVLTVRPPSPLWQQWAGSLVAKAAANLAQRPDDIAWLQGRGIPSIIVDHYRLGWLPHDLRLNRSELGLESDGANSKLWIPSGLVIPTFDRAGSIHRLRIRRTPESRERFLPDRKYEWLRGSGNEPLAIGHRQPRPRGVVIVEAELDAMAVAAWHLDVAVIAVGTVAGGLAPWQHDLCRQAPVVLVALDADPDKDGKTGAGPKAVERWLATYRQARYWPVPAGKDPGDYVTDHQGDLRSWVEAGLPPKVATVKHSLSVAAPPQDTGLSPVVEQAGGEGADTGGLEECSLVLADGTEVWLTDDKAQWLAWSDAGLLVMSSNELARIQAALVGMGPEERAEALATIIEAKRIFPAAYVCRGAINPQGGDYGNDD